MNREVVNFGRNLRFTPAHHYEPTSEAEVLAILDRHAQGKVRVVGSLHAWSPLVVTADALIDLRHLNGVEVIRKPDGTASAIVGGGCRIKHLLRKLHHLGRVTLPSVGLITEQAIAGAISTATHGSGRHSLSHYIEEVRVAAFDPDTGKARIYTWSGGAELRAARCALGCMGVILSVRFRCVPAYDVADTMVLCESLDEVLAGEERFPLQQFFMIPHRWLFFVQRRIVTPEPRRRASWRAVLHRAWWLAGIDLGMHVVITRLASFSHRPGWTRFFYRRLLPWLILTDVTVTDRSDRILVMEHELFRHLELEVFVPAARVRDAAAFVRGVLEVFDGADPDTLPLREQPDFLANGRRQPAGLGVGPALPAPSSPAGPTGTHQPADAGRSPGTSLESVVDTLGMRDELLRHRGTFTHHYPIAFRRVLPDDTLISMTAGAAEPWYAISFITYAEPRERFYAMASFLARSMAKLFDARPHWGKFFPLDAAEVERLYPELPTFRELCRRVDPHGVFRNDFTERVLFGGGSLAGGR